MAARLTFGLERVRSNHVILDSEQDRVFVELVETRFEEGHWEGACKGGYALT